MFIHVMFLQFLFLKAVKDVKASSRGLKGLEQRHHFKE